MVVGKLNRIAKSFDRARKIGGSLMTRLAPVIRSSLMKEILQMVSSGKLGNSGEEILKGLSTFLETGGNLLEGDLNNVMNTGRDALAKYT